MSRTFQSAHPVLIGLVVSALATAASYFTPADHGTTAVGFIFLAATFACALPRSSPHPPAHYGLALGGLFEPAPLNPARLIRESLRATLVATILLALIILPFAWGFELWYAPPQAWSWERAWGTNSDSHPAFALLNLFLTHLLVVALPEEVFFRGYLQTALDDRWSSRLHLLGASLGWSLVVSGIIFALGHLATTPQAGRLAVFFPSLLFGFLRARSGGVGASIVLHAQCNVLAHVLGRGYGFID